GIVRSLGRRGIPVWVLTDDHLIAAASRYARRSLPWPRAGETEQIDFLCDLAKREGLNGWLLYPTGDESAALVARHHALLSQHFRPTSPPWDRLRWTCDKRLTSQLASDPGVDQPA